MLLGFFSIRNRDDAGDGEQTGNKFWPSAHRERTRVNGTPSRSAAGTVDFDPLPASAVGVVRAPPQRESVLGQLDEVGLTERRDDGVEVELEERQKGVVRDVSRRDDE